MARRALVVQAPGSVAVERRQLLEPGPDEVVVRPAYCGLCGTDLELVRGDVDPAYVCYPLTLGHEWSGTIESVGRAVEGLSPGERCVAECIVPCGRCPPCRAGRTNVCEIYDELGFTREGGASDQVAVPARLVHVLGSAVSLLDAALVEPATVVVRALEKASPEPGSRVLVVGDGTIALLAADFARLWAPMSVDMIGRRANQSELARTVGVENFAIEGTPPRSYDVTIEAAGASDAVVTAVTAARRGGTVILLGLAPTGHTLELPADLLVNNDLILSASFGYTSAAWRRTVALLNERRIAPGRIVTHRFPLDDYATAFEVLGAADGARGKVLLDIVGEQGVSQEAAAREGESITPAV